MKTLSEGVLFGACNPLLDISAKVDLDFLKKYDLKANCAILGEKVHYGIYEDLKTKAIGEIEYIPGGSGQNALRTASWILKHKNVATFFGCTGNDANAEIMRNKSQEVGLNVVYQVSEKEPTGTCAVLITNNDRSMVAHLDAANSFTADHLDKADHWALIEKAQVYYITGFFFTVSPESIMRIAKYSMDNNRVFSINLSAPFVSIVFKDRLMAAMPYVDLVFGNEDEAMTFAKNVLDFDSTDIPAIAEKIAQLPKLSDKKRIVIITQGSSPVVVVNDGQTKQIEVPKIPTEQIVDTNGAGDAFVGGFLSQFIQGKDLDKCVDCGIWVSGLVIQRSGCTFPENMDYQ